MQYGRWFYAKEKLVKREEPDENQAINQPSIIRCGSIARTFAKWSPTKIHLSTFASSALLFSRALEQLLTSFGHLQHGKPAWFPRIVASTPTEAFRRRDFLESQAGCLPAKSIASHGAKPQSGGKKNYIPRSNFYSYVLFLP